MPKGIVVSGDLSLIGQTPVVGTSNITINGLNIALNGDLYGQGATGIASSTITINGISILLAGDLLSDGDTATASSLVMVV